MHLSTASIQKALDLSNSCAGLIVLAKRFEQSQFIRQKWQLQPIENRIAIWIDESQETEPIILC